jgi:hypothetical protein
MTLDRLARALSHCAALGIDVEWVDLGEKRRGEYRRHKNLISLNWRMTLAQSAAACGHELGHERYGDTCTTTANDRRAWEYGAGLLITPEEYAEAEDFVGDHLGALAIELGVTVPMIRAWRRWWASRSGVTCSAEALDGRLTG